MRGAGRRICCQSLSPFSLFKLIIGTDLLSTLVQSYLNSDFSTCALAEFDQSHNALFDDALLSGASLPYE